MFPSRSNRYGVRSTNRRNHQRLRNYLFETLEARMLLAVDVNWDESLSLNQLNSKHFELSTKAPYYYSYQGAPQGMVVLSDRLAIDLSATAEADLSKLQPFGLTVSRPLDGSFSVYTTQQPVTDSFLANLESSGLVNKVVPVLGMLQSKSEAVLLNEVIVALPVGTAASDYFSDPKFSSFRNLPGTPDQFIGVLKDAYGLDALAEINDLDEDGRSTWVAPNFYQAWQKFYIPNDPRFSNEWHLHNTGQGGGQVDIDSNLPEAWDVIPGTTSTIVVGVVDDGVATNHADILPWVNAGEIPGDGLDNDGNGWIDDINGWNFVGNNNVSIPDTVNDMHGTAVSGVAAAVGDNGTGVVGPAYRSPVLSARIFQNNGVASDANIAAAVYYASGRSRNGLSTFPAAQIVNHSWGGGAASPAITSAFTWATTQGRGGLGAPQFVATGNGFGAVSFPANLSPSNPGLIAVGAINNFGTKSNYSNFGPEVDIVTGSNDTRTGFLAIDTTDRIGTDGYSPDDYTGTGATGFGGTSSATPLATGVGALTLARAEQLGVTVTAAQLKAIFRNNTKLVGPDPFTLPVGRNDNLGYGLLDAFTAVQGIGKSQISITTQRSVISLGGVENVGQTIVDGTYDVVLRIRNQGTLPLNIGAINVQGADFSLYQAAGNSLLQVGESTTFTVRLLPTTPGTKFATVRVTSDDPATPTMLFFLTSTTIASSVSGYFYEDFNGNAQYTQGELGLANQRILLDGNNNGIADYQNFTNNTPVGILDNATVTSNLNVTGFTGRISDINVTVNATHTWVSDVSMELVSPSGARVKLIDGRGGAGLNITNTVFDDQAAASIAGGTAPFTGTFRPETPLSVFNSTSPNGVWTMEVTDSVGGDTGTLLNWTLSITRELTFTDNNGFYYYLAVPNGAYTDLSTTPPGYLPSGPTQYPVTINAPTDSFVDRDFGVYRNSAIYAQVFEDYDRNGIQAIDEPGLPNRQLQVTSTSSINTSVTNSTVTPIVDLQTVNIPLVVPTGLGNVQDINVRINLTHTWDSDLNISLVSPSGTIIDLSSGNGGSGDNYTNTIFDDSAATSITTGAPPFTGTFRPEQALSIFNGTPASGTWTLRITDTVGGDAGSLLSWTLFVTASVANFAVSTGQTGWTTLSLGPGTTTMSLVNIPGWIYTSPATGSRTVSTIGPPVFNQTFGTRPINLPPTIDFISDVVIDEDSGPFTVDISGLNAGRGDSEQFRVSVSTSSTASITAPVLIHSYPSATGLIAFDTVPDQSGLTVVTVVTEDAGPDNDFSTTADNLSTTVTFVVNVLPVNDSPLINSLPNLFIDEDAPQQTVNLSGILAGGGESQNLQLSVSSSNTAVIPTPTITYTSPASTGTLRFTPVPNTSGLSTIEVTLTDAGLDDIFGTGDELVVTTTFTVTVNPINDVPTLNTLPNLVIDEDAAPVTVNLSGITAGPLENQPLRVLAASGNPTLIGTPTVVYTSPNSTGSIVFAPLANQFGSTFITVIVEDGGLDNNLATAVDNLFVSRTFTVTVNPISDPPTFAPVADIQFDEDSTNQVVTITGINTGGGEIQPMRLIAKSSRPGEVANFTVNYTSPDPTGTIVLSGLPNEYGTFFITVIVEDGGLDANLSTPVDNLFLQRTFNVNVRPVNDPPTMATVSTLTINEDAPIQTVNLTGLTAGPNETELFVVSVTSSDPALIPVPTVNYAWPATTGTLNFAPAPNKFGTALIVVQVEDSGLDQRVNTSIDNEKIFHTITVVVNPVNDPPTLDPFSNLVIDEDASTQTISFTGVTAGLDELQPLRVTATSNNTALIANPIVTYTSPNTSGSFQLVPLANLSGVAVITVEVEDGGVDANLSTTADNTKLQRSFTVTVRAVNDPPVIAAISNVTVSEDAAIQTTNLSGISAGPSETQPIRVTATSSNPALIPNPTANYVSPSATGLLQWNPVANQSGVAVITVTVEDGGLDLNLATTGDNGRTDSLFTITVTPTNDAPTMNPLSDLTIDEDSPAQTISLSGITAGGGETQQLRLGVAASNPALTPMIPPLVSVSYVSPNNFGTLTFTPTANASGTSVIEVIMEDAGLDNSWSTADDNGRTSVFFTVTVTPVNDTPTLDPIADITLTEKQTATVDLLNITAGGNENQQLRVSINGTNNSLVAPQLVYTSPDSFGSISLVAANNVSVSGSSVVTVTVEDAGLDNNFTTTADNRTVVRSFTVTVNAVNDRPTFDPIADVQIDEDGTLVVTVTGISAGAGENQQLRVSALAEDNTLVSSVVSYNSPNSTATITLTGLNGLSGQTFVLFSLQDSGFDNILGNAGDAFAVATFSVTVVPVNDPPSVAPIVDASVDEDGQVTIDFSGINDGDGGTQPIQVSVTSFNGSLLASPVVNYVSGGDSGDITFSPLANLSGTSAVVVQVEDGGLDGNLTTLADNGVVTTTFTLSVLAVNDAPAFDTIGDISIDEGASQQVSVTGISAGPSESQRLRLRASSSNPAVIPTPTIVYTSPNSDGTLNISSIPNVNGSAVITVTVEDGGLDNNLSTTGDNLTYDRSFTVTVIPGNNPPTIDPLGDLMLEWNAGASEINLTGISGGLGDTDEVRIRATSSNQSVASDPVVQYVAFGSTGKVLFTPKVNAFGTTQVTVTVEDGGNDGDLGTVSDNETVSTTFEILVNAVPVAQPERVRTTRNISKSFEVLNNDSDADGGIAGLTPQFVQVPPASQGILEVQSDKSIRFVPANGFFGLISFSYIAVDENGSQSNETQVLLGVGRSAKQNPFDNLDTNNTNSVTASDALEVINVLNNPDIGRQVSELLDYPFDVDVNGDGRITPADAVEVINFLNARSGAEGEFAQSSAPTQVEVATQSHDVYFADIFEIEQIGKRARR